MINLVKPEIESTLKVIYVADVEARQGGPPSRRQMVKSILGRETPTERLQVGVADFKQGGYAGLHWHTDERCYYCVSGRAILTDINGKAYNIGPGTAVYPPPGIAGSHSWDVKEDLQLIVIFSDWHSFSIPQFYVDKDKNSTVDLERLIRAGQTSIKPLFELKD